MQLTDSGVQATLGEVIMDPETIVRAMLGAVGLPADEEEIASLVKVFTEQHAEIESLYAVAETRHESPALIFKPNPTFAKWG